MRESLEEAVRKAEAVKDTEQEIEGLRSVRVRIKKPVDFIYSLRLTGDEMTFLRDAAESRGLKLSELIRQGALEAAARTSDKPSPRDKALQEARDLVGAAAKALEKISKA